MARTVPDSIRPEKIRRQKALMAKHWNEEKLLAETKRIEAVTPHISDYQWRGIHFEAVGNSSATAGRTRSRSTQDMPLWPR